MGLTSPPVKVELLGPAADDTDALFARQEAPDRSGRVSVEPARVVATGSDVLFQALARVFADLGFEPVTDEVFASMVIARIVEPTPILDLGRVLTDLGHRPASEKTFRRTLQGCHGGGWREKIAQVCFAHAQRAGDVSLCLYDVTTLYVEAEKADDLRKVGFSKERRVDPQIVVGLLVDRGGFPLEIDCFEGLTAETTTILPIIRQFKERHRPEHMVVVADAGMLSAGNLREIDEAGFGFIVGSRSTKAPIDLASHFRWHGDAFDDGQIIDTITPKTTRTIENNPATKAEPVWNREAIPLRGGRSGPPAPSAWPVTRRPSPLRRTRPKPLSTAKISTDAKVREDQGDAAVLDEAGPVRARRLAGLKSYVTNLPATLMGVREVIGSYHDLWHVEQCSGSPRPTWPPGRCAFTPSRRSRRT